MKTAPADRICLEQRIRVFDRKFEVLGRELVRQVHRLVQVARDGDEAVSLEAVARGLLARELRQLPLDLRERLARDAFVGRQQHGRGRVVLGLAEEIGGREARVGLRVGDDQHLARPGEHVEGDFAVHLALGERDENVSGADDLVHAADGLRPVGERGDRLARR